MGKSERQRGIKLVATGIRSWKDFLWIFTHCHTSVICDSLSEVKPRCRETTRRTISCFYLRWAPVSLSLGVRGKNVTYCFLQTDATALLLNISQCTHSICSATIWFLVTSIRLFMTREKRIRSENCCDFQMYIVPHLCLVLCLFLSCCVLFS